MKTIIKIVGRPWFILALILLLAGGLRIYHLNAKSFWFDEFASAELPCGRGYAQYLLPNDVLIEHPPNLFDLKTATPIGRLWYAEEAGHLPPLYVLVMRLWGDVLGLGQTSIRSFSVVTSLGAIVAMFLVMRELSGTATALWAALLMALAGPQIQYAQEARNYMFLLLQALGAAAALVRIEKRGITFWRCATLTICVLAMTLTHYFALGTIIALAAYAGMRLRGRELRMVILCFAVAAGAWLILGAPLALRHSKNLDDPRSTEFVQDNTPGNPLRTAERAALLPVRYFTEPMGNVMAPAAVGGVAYLLAILLAWRRRDLLLWALWLWLTILPLVALDLARKTQHLEYIRYTLLASPALYALVAAALSDRPGRIRHVPPLLAAFACILALPAAYSTWWKADWRRFAQDIDHVAKPGDVTVFWRGDDYAAFPNAAYLHTSYYRHDSYGPIVLMTHTPDDALLAQLRQAPGVTVITCRRDSQPELPGATIDWKGFEPGAGSVLRATWKRGN